MTRPDVQIIRPPNKLAMKAKKGAGGSVIDRLKKADALVAELGKDFSTWGLEDIAEIDAALAEARQNPDRQEELIGDIFGRAMDLKGQGASFGYTLITEIGDSLKKFTETRHDASRRDIDIITAHVDAMRVVLTQDIIGSGGEVGRQIVTGLLQLTQK